MFNGNGRNKVVLGIIGSASISLLVFMGNSIKSNQNAIAAEAVKVRDEIRKNDDCVRQEVKRDLKEIQEDLKEVKKATAEQTTEILVAISKLETKLEKD